MKKYLLIAVVVAAVIVVLALALVFYIKYGGPRATQFSAQDNGGAIPSDFPKDLVWDPREVTSSKSVSYVNKGAADFMHYEVAYTTARPFAELVGAAEGYFALNGYNPIYKEEALGGSVEVRRGGKDSESLVVQMRKIEKGLNEVSIVYTRPKR